MALIDLKKYKANMVMKLASFSNWQGRQFAIQVAGKGFSYTGRDAIVMCDTCNATVNMKVKDVVSLADEHDRRCGIKEYILRMKENPFNEEDLANLSNVGETDNSTNEGQTVSSTNEGQTVSSTNEGQTVSSTNELESATQSNEVESANQSNEGNTYSLTNHWKTVNPANERQTVNPINESETVHPIIKQDTANPTYEGETCNAFNKEDTAIPTEEGETVLPINKQDTANPTCKEETVHAVKNDDIASPSNETVTASRNNERQAVNYTYGRKTANTFYQGQTANSTIEGQTTDSTYEEKIASPTNEEGEGPNSTIEGQTANPTYEQKTANHTYKGETANTTIERQTAHSTNDGRTADPTYEGETASHTNFPTIGHTTPILSGYWKDDLAIYPHLASIINAPCVCPCSVRYHYNDLLRVEEETNKNICKKISGNRLVLILMRQLKYNNNQPLHPDFEALEVRKSSFRNTNVDKQDVDCQTKSGFYCLGNGSRECFYCGICLCEEYLKFDPFKEHARWSPFCPHVLRLRGKEFVHDVIADTRMLKNYLKGLNRPARMELNVVEEAMKYYPQYIVSEAIEALFIEYGSFPNREELFCVLESR